MRGTSIAMSALMLTIFAVMTGIAVALYPEGARAQPLIIGVPATALCLLQLALDLRGRQAEAIEPGSHETLMTATTAPPSPAGPSAEEMPPAPARELRAWAWFLGLIGATLLGGFWIAIATFLISFLRIEAGASWRAALAFGLGATGVLYGLFGLLLRASLHEGFVVQLLRA